MFLIRIYILPSGQALPLPSRVSLSRAGSFLRPLLPSAHYFQAPAQATMLPLEFLPG